MKNKGFTLIELLVVIAIIGILSSVVLASLNSARVKGRDAKRVSDLSQLKLALELYFDTARSYPAGTGTTTLGTALVPDYIQSIPSDPLATGAYGYAGSSTSYVVYATLEDDQHAVFQGAPSGTILGVACGAPVYCVQP